MMLMERKIDKLLEKTLYSFDCMGYAIIRNAFPLEQIETAKKVLKENLDAKVWKFPILHLHPIFWDFMSSPKVLSVANALCGDQFRLDHAFGVSSSDGLINMHGGPNCSQRSCFCQWVGNNQMLIGQLSIGITLTPQSPETGGVCFIPGSHKAFDQREGKIVKSDILDNHFNHDMVFVPTLNPGDLIVFTESLIHGDTGWTPNNYDRLQIYYKFCPGFMTWRNPAEQEKYKKYARNELELAIIAPPWTGSFQDENNTMSKKNTRRNRTLDASPQKK